jgi:cytochrome P450
VESPVQVDETFDLLRDPYPLFAQKRRESCVFKGSVMDWSKTPESMLPEHLYAAVSFDAVNRVFRDGKVFNSHIYDSTIGLFIGPTILAMEGKKHWEHRNLVSAAFKSKSLLRWEPEIVRPVVNALIDEFIDAGEADLVRDFTFEFPTRVISKLLGLPEEDLPSFRQRAVELISYTVKYKRAFEASAALKDYFLAQIEQRRAKPTEDIIGDLVTAEIDGEKLSDEAIYSFLRLLLPAGLETTYRSSGNLIYCSPILSSSTR